MLVFAWSHQAHQYDTVTEKLSGTYPNCDWLTGRRLDVPVSVLGQEDDVVVNGMQQPLWAKFCCVPAPFAYRYTSVLTYCQ